MSKTKLYLSIGWVLWLVDNGFDLVFYSIERYDGEKLTIYLLNVLETMNKEFEITKNASGRVCISTFSLSKSWKVSLLLMFRYGFYRWGPYVPPITDEAVHPRFHRGKLVIESGWDNWFGYDWFADNEATDVFLQKFYYKHCHGQ